MTMDGQKDSVTQHRRRGLLRELSDLQLDVRELIDHAKKEADRTYEEEAIAESGYSDDLIVGVVLTMVEMNKHRDLNENPVNNYDLIAAGEFLDHLDTQGLEVRRKNAS